MVRRFGKWVYSHQEDLHQEGYIGILKAIDAYDNTTNVPENKFRMICAIRSMAKYCFREQKFFQNEVPVDYIDEIATSNDADTLRILQALYQDLSDIEKKILDKLMYGDYIIDIAKSLRIRKQSVVDSIKIIKTKLREIKYD